MILLVWLLLLLLMLLIVVVVVIVVVVDLRLRVLNRCVLHNNHWRLNLRNDYVLSIVIFMVLKN